MAEFLTPYSHKHIDGLHNKEDFEELARIARGRTQKKDVTEEPQQRVAVEPLRAPIVLVEMPKPEAFTAFAKKEAPSSEELAALSAWGLGKEYIVKDGSGSTRDAIAMRELDLADGLPDVTVVESQGGRILVLKPEDVNDEEKMNRYLLASRGGASKVIDSRLLNGRDIATIITEYSGQYGAEVLYDSANGGSEAAEVRSALLNRVAERISTIPESSRRRSREPFFGDALRRPLSPVNEIRPGLVPQPLPQEHRSSRVTTALKEKT
jgi:hypothetical protein